jgi:protein SCO1/2
MLKRSDFKRPGSLRQLWVLIVLILFVMGAFSSAQAHHEDGEADNLLDVVAFDQKLNEPVPLELVFRDEAGRTVTLGDFIRQKPVILLLAYYECETLCDIVLEGLQQSLHSLSFSVGDQFDLVTVSIDPTETPALAQAEKTSALQAYQRPGAAAGWHFLTGEQASISQLSEAIGFHYEYDEQTDQYAHPTGIVVLTPQGRISRYLYGIEFPATDLRLGLVEASANQIGSPVDQLLLLCYHYDPVTGQYSVLISNVLKIAGLGTVLILGSYLLVMFSRESGQNHDLKRLE